METMKDQVTTIEQSKKLLELGVPADAASMLWTDAFPFEGYELNMRYPSDACLDKLSSSDLLIPAFTVADLLWLLPSTIMIGGVYKQEYHLEMLKEQGNYKMIYCIVEDYGLAPTVLPDLEFDPKLINVAYNMVEWILTNGYNLNV